MSQVVFDGVTKRYEEVTAVDHLDLVIDDGEFMVLLGPSGCGKTTALRMIAGLEAITEGRLRIGDRVVNDVEAKDRNISMVFQSYALYPHMTVFRNIESPLVARHISLDGGEPRKLTRQERADRVNGAARTLDLEPYLDRKPGALSGGQRQRVALARAIVSQPAAYLMDEPLSNLDAKLRTQTRLELVELHRRIGQTIVYVTHDQVEAMTMATRMAVMNDGRLQQVGTPQEVYGRPANLFVARFIGSPPMNTLEATVVDDAGRPGLQIGDRQLGLPAGPLPGLPAPGGAVTIGVRPEHVHIGPGSLTGVVEAVEWLGHERLVVLDVEGTQVVVRQASDEPPVDLAATVTLAADPEHLHLFDTSTGRRLP